jgi:hypothetical protein
MPDIDEIPGNTLRGVKAPPVSTEKTETEPEPPKKIMKIITGNVIKRKKSLGEKIQNILFGEEAKSIARFVIWDVLVPNAKDLLFDMVKSALSMRLYGEQKDERLQRNRDRTHVSYDNYYRGDRERGRGRPQVAPPRSRATFAFQDIIIPHKTDAEQVLVELADVIEKYGVASVAELCDMLDITSEHTDQKWGWESIGGSYTERVRDGYILIMPRPIELT